MVSLIDSLRETLDDYDYGDVLKIIDRKEDSARYVRKLLDDMDLPEKRMTLQDLTSKLSIRMNHVLFTFSLGLILAKFTSLDTLIKEEYSRYFTRKRDVFLKVWLMTSLYHDYGYFIQNKYAKCEFLKDFKLENDIFEFGIEEKQAMKLFGLSADEIHNPRYSENVFSSYYHCYYLKGNVDEPIEHGISGGYALFDEIMKNNSNKEVSQKKNIKQAMGISKNDAKNNYYYQDMCFRIMEHNIWTINPEDSFFKEFAIKELEPIYRGNYKKIDVSEPLLMLLSLTDTIEYIKRMSTTGLDNSNAQNRPTTIAKKLNIEIETNRITIQYGSDVKRIDGFPRWKENIISLRDWLSVNTYEGGNSIIIEKA